jgi:hypothetical protein
MRNRRVDTLEGNDTDAGVIDRVRTIVGIIQSGLAAVVNVTASGPKKNVVSSSAVKLLGLRRALRPFECVVPVA